MGNSGNENATFPRIKIMKERHFFTSPFLPFCLTQAKEPILRESGRARSPGDSEITTGAAFIMLVQKCFISSIFIIFIFAENLPFLHFLFISPIFIFHFPRTHPGTGPAPDK